MSQSRRALSWWENQNNCSSQTSALLLGCSLHQVLDIKALPPEKRLLEMFYQQLVAVFTLGIMQHLTPSLGL